MADDNQRGFYRDIQLTNGALNVNVINSSAFNGTSTRLASSRDANIFADGKAGKLDTNGLS